MSRFIISFAIAALFLTTTRLEAQTARTPPGNQSTGMPQLLQNPRVQSDLGMSRQQCSQLSGGQEGQTSTDMLSQAQLQRLMQLHRQSQIASDGLGMFLFDPQVASQLDLSDDQLEEIAFMEIGFRLWSFQFMREQGFSEEAMDLMGDFRFIADWMIRDVLDDEQQALLDELLGDPLKEMATGQNTGGKSGTGVMGGISGPSQGADRAGGLFRPGQSIPNRGQSR